MVCIGLTHGYRTSGGGSNVNNGLLSGLGGVPGCTVVPFDPTGPVPEGCDVLVCTGTSAVRAPGAKTVLWPLNVAPLEPVTRDLAAIGWKSRARYRLLPLKLRRSIAHSDALVFGSRYAADLYQRRFPRAASLPSAVIRTGMPSLPIAQVPLVERTPGQILMVSHLYPYKLVVEAIEAVGAVRRDVPTAHLRIAGKFADDAYAERVKAAARAHPGAVSLLGPLAPEALLEEYARADIALLTSASENAGSFHLFDAAALGVPIVASSMSSTPSVMGDAALYVDPMQPGSIAAGLGALLRDPAERQRWADAAAGFGRDAPTWSERAETLVDFCREVSSS